MTCTILTVDFAEAAELADLAATVKAIQKRKGWATPLKPSVEGWAVLPRESAPAEPGEFAVVDAEPAPSHSRADQRATVPTSPDEGPDADPAAIDALRKVYAGLTPDQRSRIGELYNQSQRAGVGFHLKDCHTVRRFEIARGLAFLRDAVHDDETLRSLVAYAVGGDAQWPHFPSVEVGHVVGAMTATEAERFAHGCEAIVYGRLAAHVADGGFVVFSDGN